MMEKVIRDDFFGELREKLNKENKKEIIEDDKVKVSVVTGKILFRVLKTEEKKVGNIIIPESVKGETLICMVEDFKPRVTHSGEKISPAVQKGQIVHLEPFMDGQTFERNGVRYAVGVESDIWYTEE